MQQGQGKFLGNRGQKGLNEKQVFGIPGAGKTTYLAKKIGEAADKIGGERLLVSSFTKAAARELVSRDLPVPDENVGTLHALCYRLLGRPELAEKHIKEFNEEYPQYAISAQVGIDTDDPSESAASRAAGSVNDAAYSAMQVLRAQLRPPDLWPDYIRGLAERWNRFKYMNSYIDFTDMIDLCLRDHVPPPSSVSAGVFDEAQDFTPMQLALIRQWGAENLDYILVCGDDDQCLYTFLGATPDVFLNPDVTEDRRIFLEKSYRVPGLAQAKANRWISQLKDARVQKKQIPRSLPGSSMADPGVIRSMPLTWNEGLGVASYIESLLGSIPENETVMLLASCAYMLNPTLAELRARGVPYSNRYRRRRGDWNPLNPSRGVSSAKRLYSYLVPSWGEVGGYRLWTPQEVGAWIEVCESKGVFASKGKERLLAASKQRGISKDEFLDVCYGAFHEGAIDDALTLDPRWLGSKVLKSKQKAMAYPFAVMEREGVEALVREPRLTVGTIHSVKGGEADHVILMPDLSLNAAREAKESPEGYAACVRLFYVGMTRCRHSLIIGRPDGQLYVPIANV